MRLFECNLGDIVELNRKTISSKHGILKYLDTGSVTEGKVDKIVSLDTKVDKIPSRAKRLVKTGSIIYSTVRPIQRHYCYINEELSDLVVSTGFVVIDSVEGVVDSKFLYYWLTQTRIVNMLHAIGETGVSTYPSIRPSDIANLRISLPSLSVQVKISKILSSIEAKIYNNTKINEILEEIAQTLFKRWFVDFDFPNEEGKPYKSSGGRIKDSEVGIIPEGWKCVKLSEIAVFFNGFSYKSVDLGDSKTGMLTIKNFKRCGGYYSEGFREISDNSRIKDFHYTKIFDIIVAHTDITQNADIIGNPILITNMGEYENMIYSMDIVKVTSQKEESHENFFIYGQLKSRRFKEHALSYTNGTTVLHLSKDALKTYNIAIPRDEKIIDKYNKLVGNLYRIIGKNEIENNRLVKLRETLLPKLMNGEIRVPIDKD